MNGDTGSGDAIEKARKLRKELENDVVKPRSKETPTSSRDIKPPTSTREEAKAAAPARVSEPPKSTDVAPKFTQKLRPQKVTEGASLLLEVKVTATPEPKVTWSKDGQVNPTAVYCIP